MFKFLLIAVFAHLFILSLTWVGFPVPLPKNGVEFSYNGSSMPVEQLPSSEDVEKPGSVPIVLDDQEGASNFNPWMHMRELEKPKQ